MGKKLVLQQPTPVGQEAGGRSAKRWQQVGNHTEGHDEDPRPWHFLLGSANLDNTASEHGFFVSRLP